MKIMIIKINGNSKNSKNSNKNKIIRRVRVRIRGVENEIIKWLIVRSDNKQYNDVTL